MLTLLGRVGPRPALNESKDDGDSRLGIFFNILHSPTHKGKGITSAGLREGRKGFQVGRCYLCDTVGQLLVVKANTSRAVQRDQGAL